MRPLADLSIANLPVLVSANQELTSLALATWPSRPALLPGSFNPLHTGHIELAGAAEILLHRPVVFELSVANVDKADLSIAETMQRCKQFAGRGNVAITRAPRFVDKAALFPGAIFVVGADTALRLVESRYYSESVAAMTQALATLQELGCRFLVAARADTAGRLLTLSDIPIPSGFRGMFDAIPVEQFCQHISSTTLRAVRS